MIRKSGTGFPSGQTRSACPEIMLNQGNEIAVRSNRIVIEGAFIQRTESNILDKNSFFWKIVEGKMPPPPCAKTLGLGFVEIDGERGAIETRFEAVEIFLNPAGNVQGGFLAAMLDDTMGTALSATLDSGQFAPTVNLNVKFHRPAVLSSLKGLGRVVLR